MTRTRKPRATALYDLIAEPAPEGAPPATMSMADALAIAVKHAEAADPINYAYIHALKAAAVRLDHAVTDGLARALDGLVSSVVKEDTYDLDAIVDAQNALNLYRGTT